MASITFNVAKSRVIELALRVKTNDPANSALIVVPVDVDGTPDATIRDLDTLAAVTGAGVIERSTDGWSRKTLTDADLGAIAPDHANDTYTLHIPNQTWTNVTAGDVTHLLIGYDGNTGSGTDADIVPLVLLEWAITPVGSDETAKINPTNGIFSAS